MAADVPLGVRSYVQTRFLATEDSSTLTTLVRLFILKTYKAQHPDRLCDDPWLLHPPFFLVALTATLLPLQPVGPDGLRIMIGASARQEPGFRGHPPGSWRKPRVPSHCYDDAAQFREAVFSGASPERVR